MTYPDEAFVSTTDLNFTGVLNDIKKSRLAFQPIYEAVTNAIEAIKIKGQSSPHFIGEISIDIYGTETTVGTSEFNSLKITDNGVGFDDSEFRRFNTFKDFTKGFKNLGSGRIQFTHYFEQAIFKSIFMQEGKYFEREFSLSKHDNYLAKNAIVYHKYCKEIGPTETGTSVSFINLLDDSQAFDGLNNETLKESIMERYLHYFCFNKPSFPKIVIRFHVQGSLKGVSTISENDIPSLDKSDHIELPYSRVVYGTHNIEKTPRTEDFTVDAFKIPKSSLKENALKLVSKGEIVEESDVVLQSLAKNDHVNGFKYVFLVSSSYIDSRDSNLRGVLHIPSADQFLKDTTIFGGEEILLEDIQGGVNEIIYSMYPEIQLVKETHLEQLGRLKEMFLLDEEVANDILISVNDSENKILEKFYSAEAKKVALVDASIKASIDRLENLDPTSERYADQLQKEVENLVQAIPMQNKTSLTHYVARRKLILELFDKILHKKLASQNDGSRNNDEALLHNLIFQQSAVNPEESDLWLVNEDFIYFKGISEEKLKDIKIDGEALLRENLSEREEKFRKSLKEDRTAVRPDILLFPDEGKCIIIEFKNPNVNVADHLNQINNYASLIWNLSNSKFKFTSYYGYLIGEGINFEEVRMHDGDYKEAYHFDYMFRPHKTISGIFTSGDASLYTEVIKYSTLLSRARRRNEIFIAKLSKK